jgi:hypothetical protein
LERALCMKAENSSATSTLCAQIVEQLTRSIRRSADWLRLNGVRDFVQGVQEHVRHVTYVAF